MTRSTSASLSSNVPCGRISAGEDGIQGAGAHVGEAVKYPLTLREHRNGARLIRSFRHGAREDEGLPARRSDLARRATTVGKIEGFGYEPGLRVLTRPDIRGRW
jgi:hypothetical protein